VVLALGCALAACAPTTPTETGSVLTPLPPLPTETTSSALPGTRTPAAAPSAIRAVTRTTEAAASATPPAPAGTPGPATRTPVIAATPECVNDAEFEADLTVPDGAQYLPGQTFVKRWSVRNTGTCDWGPGYRLVFVSGEALTALPGLAAKTEFALYPARAGALATWEIPMRAPDTPGEYTGRWQARDPDGNLFGNLVFVTIEVIALPGAATPVP
jgi:hypothetical protein